MTKNNSFLFESSSEHDREKFKFSQNHFSQIESIQKKKKKKRIVHPWNVREEIRLEANSPKRWGERPSAISRMPIQILRPIFVAINYRVFGLMGPEVFHIGQGKDRSAGRLAE